MRRWETTVIITMLEELLTVAEIMMLQVLPTTTSEFLLELISEEKISAEQCAVAEIMM
ncbi:hypothetical protein [Rossellomorea aquimaris]|uniref:hypothetical protein n=1 Tax=Rossellomorea aquimaris TaxID=189382 RepID=UPI001CFE6030|nr:hypothetical protein [Rossellomorea aquimaris]